MPDYTRSLLRRFFAYMIDGVLAGLATSLMIVLLSMQTGYQFRITSGLLNFTSCNDAQVYGVRGEILSAPGYSSVQVCTTTVDFVSQDRRAVFSRESSGTSSSDAANASWSYTDVISFPVDDTNHAIRPIYLDAVFWIILISGAAAYESGRFQATPGKRLLGLAVRSTVTDKVLGKPALIRNLLKNSWGLYGLLDVYFGVGTLDYDKFVRNGTVNLPSSPWDGMHLSIFAGLAISVFLFLNFFGLFLPWKTAGRALYDKLARTYVIRSG